MTESRGSSAFDDLLAANRRYAETFSFSGFDGIARAGVGMVTCMDSRIDPLHMIGLQAGDAKILRNPGGRVNEKTLGALVLAVNLLGVDKVMIVQHTRCAMASATEAELRERVHLASGADASDVKFSVISDQQAQLVKDVARVRTSQLIGSRVAVGGFLYDVDTGLLRHIA